MLVELAHTAPRKEADIARLRGIGGGIAKNRMQDIFDCVEKALALPSSEYPQAAKHFRHPENITGALAMLQLLLKVSADHHGIAASMIAGKDDLEAIALGSADTPALSGWRHDIFGRQAELPAQGKLKPRSTRKIKSGVRGSGIAAEKSSDICYNTSPGRYLYLWLALDTLCRCQQAFPAKILFQNGTDYEALSSCRRICIAGAAGFRRTRGALSFRSCRRASPSYFPSGEAVFEVQLEHATDSDDPTARLPTRSR